MSQESREGSAGGFSAAHSLSGIQLVAELQWNFQESFIPFYGTSMLFSMWPLSFHTASLGFLPAWCSQGHQTSYSPIQKEAFQRGSQKQPISEGRASRLHCVPSTAFRRSKGGPRLLQIQREGDRLQLLMGSGKEPADSLNPLHCGLATLSTSMP